VVFISDYKDTNLFKLLIDIYYAPAKGYFGDLFYYANADDWIVYAYACFAYVVFLLVLYYIFNGRKGG